MITYTCIFCPRTLDTGTSSLEKAGQYAAKMRWITGLPHGQAWCDRCDTAFTKSYKNALRGDYAEPHAATGQQPPHRGEHRL